jgi:hypothetical protein
VWFARNNLAVCFMQSDLPAAVDQLEQAVQVDPHHPVQYRNLTLAYAFSARFGDAERVCRVAVDLDRTGDETARFLLGWVLVSEKKSAEAPDLVFDWLAMPRLETTSAVLRMSSREFYEHLCVELLSLIDKSDADPTLSTKKVPNCNYPAVFTTDRADSHGPRDDAAISGRERNRCQVLRRWRNPASPRRSR